MISKKIEKIIEDTEAYFKDKVKSIFDAKAPIIGAFVSIDDACENFIVNCFNCDTKTTVPITEHTKICSCPKCNAKITKDVRGYRMVSEQTSVVIRGLYESEECYVLAQFRGTCTLYGEEMAKEIPTLDRFLYYEKSSGRLSHYVKTNGVIWAKQKTKREYYYNYGYRNSVINERINSSWDKSFEELPFMTKSRRKIDSAFYDIQDSYDEYIKDNPLSKKGKKTIDMPEFPDFTQRDMINAAPKLLSFYKRQMGPVMLFTCRHCKKEYRAVESYYGPRECTCNPELMDNVELFLMDSVLQEDGSIILGFASSYIKNSSDNIEEYTPCADRLTVIGYIYATKDGIYFYNKEKKHCNLSDFNNDLVSLYTRNRYYNRTKVAYRKTEEEFISNIKNSVLSRIGFIEIIEVDNELPFTLALTKNINFLELYNKAKCMEQVAKLKMPKLTQDLCRKTSIPKFINKKESEAAKILGFTSFQLKQLRQNNAGLNELERYKKILQNDPNALYEHCRILLSDEYIFSYYEDIMRFNIPNLNSNTKRLTDYLQSLDDYQCIGLSEGMRIWIDYINMSIELKCDLKDKSLVYTNSLKLAHDRMVKKYNNLKDREVVKSFDEAIARYAHLSYENDDFLVRPPQSQEELYEEGRKLNHCVGSYAKSVADGKTIILFVRSKENVDVPYVTVQIDKTAVVQAKGKYNVAASRLPGIKKFFKEWFEEKHLTLRSC